MHKSTFYAFFCTDMPAVIGENPLCIINRFMHKQFLSAFQETASESPLGEPVDVAVVGFA
jgi:hypothetical protein